LGDGREPGAGKARGEEVHVGGMTMAEGPGHGAPAEVVLADEQDVHALLRLWDCGLGEISCHSGRRSSTRDLVCYVEYTPGPPRHASSPRPSPRQSW
jgi:hypothetical protein